jgi:fucose 4-O-acetylase-like acetyltransferase
MADSHVVSNRIDWIDAAKGIAMLLVFYGHLRGSGDNPWFPGLAGSIDVVYYFHMPLFFILSGLTFHANKDFRTFITTRFRRLIIPAYFFSLYAVAKLILKMLSPAAFNSFHSGRMSGSFWKGLVDILLGNVSGMWFFWALFWGDIVLWIIFRNIGTKGIWVAVPICLFLWCVVQQLGLSSPFHLLTSFEAIAFTGLGVLLSERILESNHRSIGIRFLCAGATFAFSACLLQIAGLHSLFVHALLLILAAISGSLAVVTFAQLIPAIGFLKVIGRNTIIYYGLNGFSLSMSKLLFFRVIPIDFVSTHLWVQLVSGAVIITLACLICSICGMIIRRWLWWAIGDRKQKTVSFRAYGSLR